MLGLVPKPPWLTCDWTLAQFGTTYPAARARLKAFVDSALNDEGWAPPNGIYFGSDAFIDVPAPPAAVCECKTWSRV